jgi:Na+/melibiose symporter-like transporter
MTVTRPHIGPVSSVNWRTVLWAARINVFAIALAGLWTPLNALLLPDHVSRVAPAALRGSALGLITVVGIGLAVFIQPIAGRASDRAPLSDRRKPFIVIPSVLCVPMIALVWRAPGFVWLLIAYVLLQVGTNIAQAAFQGLIPDLVEPAERGLVSGIKSGFDVAGTAVGLIGAGALLAIGAGEGGALAFLATLLMLGVVLTWRWTPAAPPATDDAQGRSLRDMLSVGLIARSFTRFRSAPRSFQMAVGMRLLFLLGAYPVQRFLLFYLEDRFGIADPATQASGYLLGGFLLGVCGAAAGGLVSDRAGRSPVLAVTVGLTVFGLLGLAFAPTLVIVAAGGGLVAVGFGSFQAVNWALLSDTMPEGQGAQFYGLANIATAGAGALAGLLGPLIDVANGLLPAGTYHITFGLAAAITMASLLPLRRLGAGRGH